MGFAYGYTMSIRFFYLGVVFMIGAKFTDKIPTLSYQDVFQSIYMIFVVTIGAVFALDSTPSVS
jgi:hypothetical protein